MDRVAILDAYYWFFVSYHGGQFSTEYARLCRLQRYYRPSILANGPMEEAKPLYRALVRRWKKRQKPPVMQNSVA